MRNIKASKGVRFVKVGNGRGKKLTSGVALISFRQARRLAHLGKRTKDESWLCARFDRGSAP